MHVCEDTTRTLHSTLLQTVAPHCSFASEHHPLLPRRSRCPSFPCSLEACCICMSRGASVCIVQHCNNRKSLRSTQTAMAQLVASHRSVLEARPAHAARRCAWRRLCPSLPGSLVCLCWKTRSATEAVHFSTVCIVSLSARSPLTQLGRSPPRARACNQVAKKQC